MAAFGCPPRPGRGASPPGENWFSPGGERSRWEPVPISATTPRWQRQVVPGRGPGAQIIPRHDLLRDGAGTRQVLPCQHLPQVSTRRHLGANPPRVHRSEVGAQLLHLRFGRHASRGSRDGRTGRRGAAAWRARMRPDPGESQPDRLLRQQRKCRPRAVHVPAFVERGRGRLASRGRPRCVAGIHVPAFVERRGRAEGDRPLRVSPGFTSRPFVERGRTPAGWKCAMRCRRDSRPATSCPSPPGPARHAMRTGARSVRGHTSSADPASSPPPLRGGASTVRRPPVRRLAASTSTRRLLTRSRPPWLRSSACRRWTGSNRAGACVRHGRATAIAVRSSAFSTASLPDASACWRARRSIAWTTAGSTPPARAASTRSTRGPGATSARTAPNSSGSPSPGEGTATLGELLTAVAGARPGRAKITARAARQRAACPPQVQRRRMPVATGCLAPTQR